PGAMDAEQRIALDADDFPLRASVAGGALAPADEMRQRVVHDGNFRGKRRRLQQQLLMPVDDPGNRTCGAGPLRDRAIELIQAESSRLVPRTHRIPGVVVDAARAT